MRWLVVPVVLVVASAAAPAYAHPHVLVTAAAELIFDDTGSVISIRETWTFDEMYTAFAITGFGTAAQTPTRDQLHEVARQNMDDLLDYHYFTSLKGAGRQGEFAKPTSYSASLRKSADAEQLQLVFDVPLKRPMALGREALLRIYDPSYFTAFSFEAGESVRLVGATKCTVSRSAPKPLEAIDQRALSESFFTNMLPGTDFGLKLAESVRIACP